MNLFLGTTVYFVMLPNDNFDRGALIALIFALVSVVLVVYGQQPIANLGTSISEPRVALSKGEKIGHLQVMADAFDPWDDTYAQWGMALFGLLATIVSIWAVFLLKYTLLATRDAVRAADDAVAESRRIGEAQVRAYLSPKIEFVPMLEGDTPNRPAIFDLSVTNTGQTPARNIYITMGSGWQPKVLPVPCPDMMKVVDFAFPNDSFLASGDTMHSRLRDNGLTYLDLFSDSPKRKHFDPYVFGIIFYKDVFGKSYKLRFCWRVTLSIVTDHVPDIGEEVGLEIQFETANAHNGEGESG